MENTSRGTKSKLFRPSLKILHNWFPRIANSSFCACLPSSPGSTRAAFPLLVTANTLEFPKHIKALIFAHFLFPPPQNTISFVWTVFFYMVDFYTSLKTSFTCANLFSLFLKENSQGLCTPTLCCMAFNTRYLGDLNRYLLPLPELMNPTELYLNLSGSAGH